MMVFDTFNDESGGLLKIEMCYLYFFLYLLSDTNLIALKKKELDCYLLDCLFII